MLHFQIAYTATHIPDDIVLLPVIPEGFGKFIVGFVHDMQGSIIGSFKASLIEWYERVSTFEEVISIFCFWWLVVDLPELAVSFFVPQLVDMTSK
jgi:hypothetical protein